MVAVLRSPAYQSAVRADGLAANKHAVHLKTTSSKGVRMLLLCEVSLARHAQCCDMGHRTGEGVLHQLPKLLLQLLNLLKESQNESSEWLYEIIRTNIAQNQPHECWT